MRNRLMKNERGAALLETAITIPIILLISVGIFEFGRAYQTWQVLTNAAREGARMAIIEANTDADVCQVVKNYISGGKLPPIGCESINVNRLVPFSGTTASQVTISYPFNFTVLNPVARLVTRGTNLGSAPLNMTAVALMRNEG